MKQGAVYTAPVVYQYSFISYTARPASFPPRIAMAMLNGAAQSPMA
jgi:hypothetical protein